MVKIRTCAAVAVGLLLLASCGQSGEQGRQELTVLAAASLTESFDELGQRFEQQHEGVRIRFDYQGSSTLAEQIDQGRPADVFASADEENMAKVTETGAADGQSQTFATNRLTIAVPPGNPAEVRSLADLTGDRSVVICEPDVPCGSATAEVARAAGVSIQPASEENDVKSVLQKVIAGEADAGLVYVSDAQAAGEAVQTVDFPESGRAINEYPIVTLRGAPEPGLADEFTEFVRGPEGREVLERNGFGAP
ncbi:molybdate ABC transporter substrate-binding protein [Saccharopolyspora sp. HNM0983]|uniref:Molybdate ABC transporter substrate-binding protein n=1 Tax=Saccharopolyspora montiporae TaxID=2781240 RepID=A0A929BAI6_9PSEU|nr:molybdate ABC transporter substrate-binding protein [Saccharopolyspora sp. HNM0983]MBE9374037.1 molybdate ABC transporter substrate-binding protein [Saccharopolyspora sp. HNM0983]